MEFTTLGSVGLSADGIPLSGRVTQRRRLALLALLAAAGDAGLTRDKLLAFLWPDRDTAGARHALSQTLYAVRQELGQDVVHFGVDVVRLNRAVLRCDVADLNDAIAAGDAGRIVALYRGPFLDGFFLSDVPGFEEWVEEERQRLADAHARALEKLARSAAAAGDASAAADWWARRAALDPLNSAIALELVRARAAAGDRAGALRHVRVHTQLLRQEMETEPDPALTDFADALRDSATVERPAPVAREREAPVAGKREAPATGERTAPSAAVATERSQPTAIGWPAREAAAAAEAVHAPPTRLDPVPVRRRRLLPLAAGVLALALVAATATTIATRGTAAAPSGTEVRHLLLGDLEGTDRELVLAVREALRAELSVDTRIRLIQQAKIDESLSLMRHSGREVSGETALQVAQRLGAPLLVTGSATPLGTGLQLVVQLRDARSGDVIATLAERPAREADVIPSVLRVAGRLRELAAGAERAGAGPLPAVTTASLPALRNYSLARQALFALDRRNAVLYGEAALVHDSTFALAHYLLGDVLWFIDEQRHSDEHIQRAWELSAQLPPRERLIVRARYEQLVRDEPDSAIAYWRLLSVSHPDEALAYEGLRWGYRALAQWDLMAEASDSAARRDSTWLPNHFNDQLLVQLFARDSAAVFATARAHGARVANADELARYGWAFTRRDWRTAAAHAPNEYARHLVAAAAGDRKTARTLVNEVVSRGALQEGLRAMILQACMELEAGGSPARARELLRRALDGTASADLSPPAYARLAERIADAAARSGDEALIAEARALIVEQDRGRGLRSYRAALQGIDAAAAFAAGDYRRAAALAAASKPIVYYGRSVGTLLLLEADARAALGDSVAADALLAAFRKYPLSGDADHETYAYLQRVAAVR